MLVVQKRVAQVGEVFEGYRRTLKMVFPAVGFRVDQPVRMECLKEVAWTIQTMFVIAQRSVLVIEILDLDCMVHKGERGSRVVECLGRYPGSRVTAV